MVLVMYRFLKRRRAIKKFVIRLPLTLGRRFGEKRFYSMPEVNTGLTAIDGNMAFAAYAHSLLCNRQDFDEYCQPLGVKCAYDQLRTAVAKRFFRGIIDFDGAAVLRFARDYPRNFIRTTFMKADWADPSTINSSAIN